ncbi:MAG: IS701 family transposase [Chitinophagales bacterium]
MHDCKSNIEQISARVMNSEYDQLHHFISVSPWDSFAVEHEVAEKVYNSLSSSSDDSNIGLLLDESGWEKSGKKSVGVARQYIGQRGKVANGQVGVFAGLSNGTEVGLLQGRLYLPQSWTQDPIRCKKAGIPANEQVYRTKPELSIEIIKSLPKNIHYAWVGGDCLYGNSPTLRQYLYDTERDFVLDVGEKLEVYLEKPEIYLPAKKGKKGRTPSKYVCDTKPIALKKLVAQIPKKQWKTITHRHGTKGAMVRKALMLDVYIWKPDKGTNIETVQLLISMKTDNSEIKYSLCYSAKQKMSLKTAL